MRNRTSISISVSVLVFRVLIEATSGGVLQKRCSLKCRKFYSETPMLEFLFNKVYNFNKKSVQYSCFTMKFAKFLRTPIFQEHLRMTLAVLIVSHNGIMETIYLTILLEEGYRCLKFGAFNC